MLVISSTLWIDRAVDLEDALATAQEHNAQLQQLVDCLQTRIEALHLTQRDLIEQIRTLTEMLEEQRAVADKEREAAEKEREAIQHQLHQAQAQNQEFEAAIHRMTLQIDALLVRLGDKEPPEKPKKKTDPKDEASDNSSPSEDDPPDASGSAKDDDDKTAWTHPNHHPHGRSGPPGHLARDTQHIAVEAGCCPHCQCDRLHRHSELVSEAYDVVRAHLRVRKITREVRRCANCRKRITAPMPPMPFERIACTFEMLAYLAYLKLVLFVPLDRINRDFTAQGAPIGSAMLSRWFHECGKLLEIVAAQMRLELLSEDHLRFDATGLTLVDFSQAGDRLVLQGQVIVFCTPELTLYHPAESKHGEHIEAFLTLGEGEDARPWQGTATADAVNIHDQIFDVDGRTESGCNAHGLRKFRDDADCAPLIAQVAMGFIGGMYAVEKQAKEAGLSGAELLAYRQQHAGPIAKRFRDWLDAFLATSSLSKKNPVRKAVQYYDNHWTALTEFLRDPEVDLDNNLSERLLRNIALLRKNALFSGTGERVQRLCAMLSVLQTCRLLQLDPYEYLVWVLPKLVTHPDNRGRSIVDLTPAAYKRQLGAPEGFG